MRLLMRSRTIAVANQKGGTGKTTTVHNLSTALAAQGYSVCALDLDPQANLSYCFGATNASPTIADAFFGESSLQDCLVEAEGVALVPGSQQLVDVELSLSRADNGREQFLKKLLEPLRGKFDYILIDVPPSMGLLNLNALIAADEVIIPMQLEVLALQGLSQILASIEKINTTFSHHLKELGILLVMYDRRRRLSMELLEYLQQHLDKPVFNTIVRANVKVAEAPSFGQSVLAYAPKSPGANDYRALAHELAQLTAAPPGKNPKKQPAVA